MTTKKMKKPSPKPATHSQKIEAVGNSLPGQLEKEFRRSLGQHNTHLNMLDVSAQTFADTLSKQPSEARYIRDCAKKLDFHSLYPNASFASARTYLVYSHIAYVFSAGDMLCSRIRATPLMKALKKDNTELFNEIDTGDFVSKTLALTVLATLHQEEQKAGVIIKGRVGEIQLLESFALVNYYRLIRNDELHSAGALNPKIAEARNALPDAQIKALYGLIPAPADKLSSRDALLCSKAWQSVAKWLCRHMLNDAEARLIIKKRFGRLAAPRRNAAARKFMELELLYSHGEINDTIDALQW